MGCLTLFKWKMSPGRRRKTTDNKLLLQKREKEMRKVQTKATSMTYNVPMDFALIVHVVESKQDFAKENGDKRLFKGPRP